MDLPLPMATATATATAATRHRQIQSPLVDNVRAQLIGWGSATESVSSSIGTYTRAGAHKRTSTSMLHNCQQPYHLLISSRPRFCVPAWPAGQRGRQLLSQSRSRHNYDDSDDSDDDTASGRHSVRGARPAGRAAAGGSSGGHRYDDSDDDSESSNDEEALTAAAKARARRKAAGGKRRARSAMFI